MYAQFSMSHGKDDRSQRPRNASSDVASVARRDQPAEARATSAPRGAYAVLGLVVWGVGVLVVLLDALGPFGEPVSLDWLWLSFFGLGALLVLAEFLRHWRRTLRPMSVAFLVVGAIAAAIDLGGLMIRRLFLVWGWGPLIALAGCGLLLSRWIRRRHPDAARSAPAICSVHTPGEQDRQASEGKVRD